MYLPSVKLTQDIFDKLTILESQPNINDPDITGRFLASTGQWILYNCHLDKDYNCFVIIIEGSEDDYELDGKLKNYADPFENKRVIANFLKKQRESIVKQIRRNRRSQNKRGTRSTNITRKKRRK